MQKVIFVRHGECYMNLELSTKVGGRSNSSPLTPLGQEQSLRLGIHLRRSLQLNGNAAESLHFFSSTAVRARDTALAVMEALKVPSSELTLSEELLELDMGDWEGAERDVCYSPDNLALIRQDVWRFAPPGGESQKQVEERMLRYLKEEILPRATPQRPALVFSHGLAIKCLLRGLLGANPSMTRNVRLDNTAITEIGFQSEGRDQGWHIIRVNDTTHLVFEVAAATAVEAAAAQAAAKGAGVGSAEAEVVQ